LICFLLVFSFVFVFAYSGNIPNSGHGGDGFFIFVNGVESDLQAAIDSGRFGVDYTGAGSYRNGIRYGHDGSTIFVNVNGFDKSFQDAINDGSLCSSSGGGSGSYSGSDYAGHVGEDVLVDFRGAEKTLQQAINAGDFGYSTWSPALSNTCTTDTIVQTNCGRTRTMNGTKCCDRLWAPAADTKCLGESFTQTSDCGNTRTEIGTKCCDTTWTPNASTVESGVIFTQISNCGNTQNVAGTCTDTEWLPATNTVWIWDSFTQTKCGASRVVQGSKKLDCRYTCGPSGSNIRVSGTSSDYQGGTAYWTITYANNFAYNPATKIYSSSLTKIGILNSRYTSFNFIRTIESHGRGFACTGRAWKTASGVYCS